MSAWFTFARTRIEAGFTTSTIGMPLRTSSPSCTSAMVFDFQIDRRTAIPAIGELDGHPIGVALRLAHRVLGAIPPNLQDLEVRFAGTAASARRSSSAASSFACASSSACVFFSAWIFGSISFLTISSCARPMALCACSSSLSSFARAARRFRFLLLDLLLEIVELDPAVERVLELILAIELDEQIALAHHAAGAYEPGDDEGIVVLAGEPGRRNGGRLHRLDRAGEPHGPVKSRRLTVELAWRWPPAGTADRCARTANAATAAPPSSTSTVDRPAETPRCRGQTNSGYQTANRAVWLASCDRRTLSQ